MMNIYIDKINKWNNQNWCLQIRQNLDVFDLVHQEVCDDEKYTFQKPLVYGDLHFDEDETSALLLDPKFAVYDILSEEDFDVEVETCLAKMRWNNMNKEEDEEQSSIQ